MKKGKKIILITGILLILISAGVGIYAYLSDSDEAVNRVTVGGVNVSIIEDFPPPGPIEPGTVITKDVKVQNDGPSGAYVRIKAVFTDSEMGNNCTVDWNTSDFVYDNSDGYYYYTKVLDVGDITESLFTKVEVSSTMSADDIKDFDILVYAEAFQSEGFDDYESAWEYFYRNHPDNQAT